MATETNYSSKMLEYLRAGGRVNSQVKVSVEWEEEGKTHSAEGTTRDISSKGCMAIVPQGLAVGQELVLKNELNQKSSNAKLIWRGHEGRGGWELGLELVEPPTDFWDMEF